MVGGCPINGMGVIEVGTVRFDQVTQGHLCLSSTHLTVSFSPLSHRLHLFVPRPHEKTPPSPPSHSIQASKSLVHGSGLQLALQVVFPRSKIKEKYLISPKSFPDHQPKLKAGTQTIESWLRPSENHQESQLIITNQSVRVRMEISIHR